MAILCSLFRCFSYDKFPSRRMQQAALFNNRPTATCCILNTHPSHRPGEHWLAFFSDPITCKLEFFDSYGFPSNFYNLSSSSVITSTPSSCFSLVASNNVQLQSYTSSVCGHYCLLYLYLRSLLFLNPSPTSHSVSHRMLLLAPSPTARDQIVCQLLCRILAHRKPSSSSSSSTPFLTLCSSYPCQQSCRSLNLK